MVSQGAQHAFIGRRGSEPGSLILACCAGKLWLFHASWILALEVPIFLYFVHNYFSS